MNMLIITSAPLIYCNDKWYAYAPYVDELEIWNKHSEGIQFCCPVWNTDKGILIKEIHFTVKEVIALEDFNLKTILNTLTSIKYIFKNVYIIYKALKTADHIHLRCPGNMGLLGALVQILFPHKPKTAKYAGNWDPKAQQPFSYRMQKWILSNTWLTKNMQVLVYGNWPNQSKNIKPFFTATYSEHEADAYSGHPELGSGSYKVALFNNNVIKCLFVGTLTLNKRPLLCAKAVQQLIDNGYQVELSYYGEGPECHALENFILDYNLQEKFCLKGNVPKESLIQAYLENHFILVLSQSEGWPKAVAEAMFWGCLPITTAVSCVPMMVDYGKRGALVEPEINSIVSAISYYRLNESEYKEQQERAISWSRQFTLEKMEAGVKEILDASTSK